MPSDDPDKENITGKIAELASICRKTDHLGYIRPSRNVDYDDEDVLLWK